MTAKQLLRTLFLTLLVATPALAQEATTTTLETDRAVAAEQELKLKALGLLEDVIKDSELYRHAENRIRIRAAAANVLWDYDQARARLLFKEVMAGLGDLLNNLQDEESTRTRMIEGPRQLRRELLGVLARRDPRLARELLRSTRSEEPGARVPRGDVLADRPLELSLATQIAESDPNQALEIAEESLPGGLSYELPAVLSALQAKDPAAASRLASQIVVRLRTEKLGESDVAKQVAVSVLRLAAQTPGDDGKAAKSAQPLLDAQAMNELIEKLAAEVLRANSTSPELLEVLQEVMPAVERYAPARAAQLRRKAGQPRMSGEVVAQAIPTADPLSKYQEILEKGTVDEILAAAEEAPAEMRDTFYQLAARKVMEEGDATRARQIINEHFKDPAQRRYMLGELNELAAYAAARQGNLEQARKMIATMRTNEERVMALVQLAGGATEKGDKKLALALLGEAQEMISARAKNARQLLSQLAVAKAYAPLDASRSLAILEPVVDQLNELLAAGVVLGSFFVEELVQDDEIMMEPLTSLANEIFNAYIGDFGVLARADFERTRDLADRFQRPEIRTIARLLVAQSILMPQTPVTTKQSGSVIMGRIQ